MKKSEERHRPGSRNNRNGKKNRDLKSICLLLFSALFIFTGCHDDEDIPEIPASTTVLVYMAADNSMDSDVNYSLEQLKTGATKSSGTTVVYLDRENETPRLLEITHDGEEVLLKNYDEENSASAETLARVIRETKELKPADRFGLVLWSHAMGWLPYGYSTTTLATRKVANSFPRTRYIGIDSHPGNSSPGSNVMDIKEMAEKIPAGTAEFILFDVCLMGSVEALYELRHTCNYMIASPTEVLAEADWDASGMPYDEVLPLLSGDEEDLVRACQAYYNHYNGLSSEILRSATISLVDAAQLDVLYQVAESILQGKLSQAGDMSVNGLQIYYTPAIPHVFFDLGDVMQQLSSNDEYARFKEQLANTVLYKAATSQFINMTIDPDHFSGLSSYVPLNKWSGNTEYAYYFTMEWSGVY